MAMGAEPRAEPATPPWTGQLEGPYPGSPDDVLAELVRDEAIPGSVQDWDYWEREGQREDGTTYRELWLAPIEDEDDEEHYLVPNRLVDQRHYDVGHGADGEPMWLPDRW
jgi:hypothetical protein